MIARLWLRFLTWLLKPVLRAFLEPTDYVIGHILDRLYAAEKKVANMTQAMAGIRAAADGGYRGRNWVLLSFRRGNQEIVHVFDFGTNNMGALIDMLRGFERAGLCVTADLPPGVKVKS